MTTHLLPFATNRRRVLFVSAEIFPLAKTGGMADVCGALPAALGREGDLDILLMMPGYDSVFAAMGELRELAQLKDLPGGDARLLVGLIPGTDQPLVLLDQPDLFRRPGSLYVDEEGREWPDNAVRFASLCHAAAALAAGRALPYWHADLVHCHDWHTGLIPLLLAAEPRRPSTVLTIHNLAFQGLFPAPLFDELRLPSGSFSVEGCEFFGQISFLKAGINFADKLTTVSPSYAEEITTSEFGMGLEGLLARRRSDLIGILNGIDEVLWNPATDRMLADAYSADDLSGKSQCKTALQHEWGLAPDPDAPLFVFAARLEDQKMADTLLAVMPDLLERPGTQIAILGRGNRSIEEGFAGWPARAPGRVAARIGYAEEWARQLFAGGDMLIHGSRFEPCGLTPLYALRYGAVPIVRSVGGLKDTVVGVRESTLADGMATGFSFADATGVAMLDAIDAALALFRQPDHWSRLMQSGMRRDFSWRRSVGLYRRLYDELTLSRQAA
ncbi:MAG TPA: glycogen synthase GlgA [Aliidongia sp.]|nr:glycogen synthase GlgA [Aliidongia sp.]